MRLKQLALALLCSGALVAPALAQNPPAAKPAAPVTGAAPIGGATATTGGTPTPSSPGARASVPAAPPATQGQMVNINTASAKELDKLPQIGKARAAAIIKGRPYTSPDDLVTKKVLTKSVYDKIKPRVTT